MSETGYVLDAKQTTYARKVEAMLKAKDEAPFPTPYVVYCQESGLTPWQCVQQGMRLAR